MSRWPMVALGEIAPIVRREASITPEGLYPELGIRSFGKGAFHKPAVEGHAVGTKRLFEIRPGDLLFSNVFAWEGAVAVASEADQGRYGSHRFISCVADESKALAQYLRAFFVTPVGIEKLGQASPGGAGRNRTLGVEKLARILVPLPPLAEQQAIVTRLDALAEKSERLTAHWQAIADDAASFILSLNHKLASGSELRLGDLIELWELEEEVKPDHEYPQAGLLGFGGGLFLKAAVGGASTTYKTFNRLYSDAIVLSQLKGWEGALALCPPTLAGRFVSPEYRTFRCIPDRASPAYLSTLMTTPWFWSLMQKATRGVGARRERIKPGQFLDIALPIPTLDQQRRAESALSKLQTLAVALTAQCEQLGQLRKQILELAFT